MIFGGQLMTIDFEDIISLSDLHAGNVIEDIQARHEALLCELTDAVQDLGSVLSPDHSVPGGMVIAAEEPVEDPGELMLVFEEPEASGGAWDEWVDHGSWTAAVLRSVDKS